MKYPRSCSCVVTCISPMERVFQAIDVLQKKANQHGMNAKSDSVNECFTSQKPARSVFNPTTTHYGGCRCGQCFEKKRFAVTFKMYDVRSFKLSH